MCTKRLFLTSVICFLATIAFCRQNDHDSETTNDNFKIENGEDWTFPSFVKPKFRSGFGIMERFSNDPLIRNAGATLTWSMLNPEEGVYDFSELEKWLNRAKANNGLVLFRLKASVIDRKSPWTSMDFSYMPEWVVEKHNPPTFYTRKKDNGQFLLYGAPWDEGVQQEFKQFIEEFARRKYLENEHLLAVYLHGISSSYGEEFYISREFTPQLVEAGMTKERLMKCFKDRMDWWAAVAGEHLNKLAWVGAREIEGFDYPKYELDEYAFSKGFGSRGGFIEHYFYPPIVPPVAGQRYENGYVINDYSNYMHDGRMFGDECEEDDEFGDAQGEELKFMQQSCFYQAARVGVNFLWVSNQNIEWAPEVAKWYTMVAGKIPRESPDASCWLREAYVRDVNGDRSIRTWKNFERMLMQRDMDEGQTVPTVKYDLNDENSWIKDPDRRYEYSARRTDVGAGQNKMFFLLNDDFEESIAGDTEIKLTYLDNSSAKWDLIVSTTRGIKKYGSVTGENDGKWKTVTFSVMDTIKKGALDNDVSFYIEVQGDEDVTVKHARVLKGNWASNETTRNAWQNNTWQFPGDSLQAWQYDFNQKIYGNTLFVTDSAQTIGIYGCNDTTGVNIRSYNDAAAFNDAAQFRWDTVAQTFSKNGQWLEYSVDFRLDEPYQLLVRARNNTNARFKLNIFNLQGDTVVDKDVSLETDFTNIGGGNEQTDWLLSKFPLSELWGSYIVRFDWYDNVGEPGIFGGFSFIKSELDATAPEWYYVSVGNITQGTDISVMTTEDAMVYLVPEGTSPDTTSITEAAVAAIDVVAYGQESFPTNDLSAGNYVVYALDEAKNISESSSLITVQYPVNSPTVGYNPEISVMYNSADKLIKIKSTCNLDRIDVYSVLGKKVKSVLCNGKSHEIDINGFNTGIYLVNVFNTSGTLKQNKISVV